MFQASVSGTVIKSSLIEPDGGVLVDVIVPESERGSKTLEAESMPKARLAKIDVEWVHVISEGWASPLKGFTRENEYLQSLHFNSLRMENGTKDCLEKLNILPFRVAAYDTVAKKMAFFDPSRSKEFLFISGTKVLYSWFKMWKFALKNLLKLPMRTYARNGENPPDGFMCPGGWEVLVKYYEQLQAEEAMPAVASA
ncbi:hypothetical protein POTOM_009371 [Populus tomentosa]|uniref:ATP-sulfurylase PUA-like domain-containing protein n=1 Tax=Populus tomentosa TaxID=118781 RepID=A0A8X8AAX7_POPTO|nr:hypothetical protein POTOM_009371 [Populus tomentosa]